MGPADGDELNLIQPARNYGWPIVSEGEHYDGTPIPSHATRPDFTAPIRSWVPQLPHLPSTLCPRVMKMNGPQMPLSRAYEAAHCFVCKSRKIVSPWKRCSNLKRRLRDVLPISDDRIWLIEDGKSARLLSRKNKIEKDDAICVILIPDA